jgi:hypothetical protein
MKQFQKSRNGVGSITAFLLTVAACSQVLGIDEARVDPNLKPGLTTDGGTDLDASGTAAGGSISTEAGLSNETTGTGGAGGSGAVDSGGNLTDAGADSGDSATCRQYCSDIMTYCGGELKQYVDAAQCLKVCAIYPDGSIGDADGNTASCRLKYASKAHYASGTEKDAYCRKAGPGSDGTCGAICDGFCTLMMATCTTKFAPYYFPSASDCLTTCRALKDSPPFTVSDGSLPDRNDAQCRLFHSCSAVMDPDEHCEHAMGVTMCDPKIDSGHAH